MFTFETYGRPIRFTCVTASTTATRIPSDIKKPVTGTWMNREAEAAFVSVEGANIRFRYDGVAASLTHGHKILDGYSILIRGVDAVKNFSFCSCAAAAPASIFITTYILF